MDIIQLRDGETPRRLGIDADTIALRQLDRRGRGRLLLDRSAPPRGRCRLSLPGLTVTARLLIAAGIYLAALGGLWLKTRKTLAAARGVLVRAQRGRRATDPAIVTGDTVLFESIVARLDELDCDSDLTPAQYEHRWAGIYEQLGALAVIDGSEPRR